MKSHIAKIQAGIKSTPNWVLGWAWTAGILLGAGVGIIVTAGAC